MAVSSGAVDPRAMGVGEVAQEKRKLKKSLYRWDLALFTICALVGIDTLGQAASFGTQTLFWLVFLGVFFLLPYAFITAELATRFPVEGAVYEWVRLAFGHLAGGITAVIYWISNPVWLGGTLAATAVAAMDALWGTNIGGNEALSIVVGFVFIWLAIAFNILSLRHMKWVPALGTIVRVCLLALFGILVIAMVASGKTKGSISSGDLAPTGTVFLGVLGVLIFNYVGFETQSNASEEMEDPQRDVPRSISISWIVTIIAYLIPVAGILLALSSKDIGNVSGFVTGYQSVVNSALGVGPAKALNLLVGAAVVFSLMAGGVVWLMGSDRAMAIGALAGSGPRGMGYFSSRFGTPIVVNVISGIVATMFMLFNFLVTSGNLKSFFAVVLSLVISTTTFSYVLVFPAIIALRVRYGTQGRGYRIPGGLPVVVAAAVLCEFFVVAATVFSLWPGIFTSTAMQPVSGLARSSYELTVLLTMAVIIGLAVVFWVTGRSRQVSTIPEDLTMAAETRMVGRPVVQ